MLSEEKREKARAVWNDAFDKLYEKAPSMFDYGSNLMVGYVDEYRMFDAITGEELILVSRSDDERDG